MPKAEEQLGTERPPVQSFPEIDPVIAAYMPGVDRTLLLENLKLTVEERFEKMRGLQRMAEELRRAGQQARKMA